MQEYIRQKAEPSWYNRIFDFQDKLVPEYIYMYKLGVHSTHYNVIIKISQHVCAGVITAPSSCLANGHLPHATPPGR